MTFKYSEKDILEKLKKQNSFLNDSELKIEKTYEYKRYNRVFYQSSNSILNFLMRTRLILDGKDVRLLKGLMWRNALSAKALTIKQRNARIVKYVLNVMVK